jgi:transcriptional regulator with XRE-family HTH domain
VDPSTELRDFLRSRRARLEPPDVGLQWRHGGRRVPGLRREELALVAGVSVDYYTRLEQGRARNVSAQVLDSLADALKLDDLERAHLHTLAHPAGTVRKSPEPPVVKASAVIRSMIDTLDPTPVLLHGPILEVLAINRMGRILFDDFSAMPIKERNLARWTFLNPRARVVYPRWDVVAAQMVAILRRAAGIRVNDPRLSELVGELSVASSDFARWWASHTLFQHVHGQKVVHHELVGDLDLHYQSLTIPQEPDQYMVLYTAAMGSPSAEKLSLLSTWNPKPGGVPADETGHIPAPVPTSQS